MNQVPSCPMGIGYSETPYIEIATPPTAARNDTSAKQSFTVSAKSAQRIPSPGGEGGRAQRGRMRNAGEQFKVRTGLELNGSARIPHPPLRGNLSPGEGIAWYILHTIKMLNTK